MDVSKLFKVIDGKVCISSLALKRFWDSPEYASKLRKARIGARTIGWYQLLSVISSWPKKKELQQVTVKSRLHK
ncbi:hypothetical protein [Paenibacillus melissococcoides]|uniref:hypothetical protein n=1 Tax=Paenibacillus melissococcoides TaxID=2912268 RepID=UPI0021C25528|nr:hypothetical protein [Paenibacillus melissococcoides]